MDAFSPLRLRFSERMSVIKVKESKSGMPAVPIARPSLPDLADYVRLLEDIWESRMLSNFGKYAREWERKAQSYLDNENVLAVSSCDIGLIISIAAYDLPKGSECILPSFTFNSSANCVVWNGLTPVFCDVDRGTFNADPADVEARISSNTSAILCTHVFGNPCDNEPLRRIAKRHDLAMIFDSAQAFGAEYQGQKIGSFGDIEVFSFSGTKLSTTGEGGLIATDDPNIAQRLQYLRGYGFQVDYNTKFIGLNGKISELAAALGCLSIDEVGEAVAIRGQLAAEYKDLLGGIDEIDFQEIREGNRTTYKDFAIVCDERRDELSAHLSQSGIQTKKYFRPIHQMSAFDSREQVSLPNTEWLADHVLCVPIFNELTFEQVRQVADLINRFYS